MPFVRSLNARFGWFVAPWAVVRRLLSTLRWAADHSALAAGATGRAALFLTLLALPLKRRLAPGLALPARLRLAGGSRVFWFKDASELFALEDIFEAGEYAVVADADPEVIVDLGSNAGQAALWFRDRFPAARIVCVEPDPRTFALAEAQPRRRPPRDASQRRGHRR